MSSFILLRQIIAAQSDRVKLDPICTLSDCADRSARSAWKFLKGYGAFTDDAWQKAKAFDPMKQAKIPTLRERRVAGNQFASKKVH